MERKITLVFSSGKEIVLTKSKYDELVDFTSGKKKGKVDTKNVNNWD